MSKNFTVFLTEKELNNLILLVAGIDNVAHDKFIAARETPVDYRKILIEYIGIVGQAEGVSFLPWDPVELLGDLNKEETKVLFDCEKIGG